MAARDRARFGFAVAPVGEGGDSDAALYEEVIADCRLGHALGYESAWMLEHHFSDYFPTPSPTVFMSQIAARCPGLGLGTCVLVLPWYHPLRFAEELSMLSILSQGELHIGIGRGTARLEYDAYGVDMNEARERFREGLEIVRLALAGEPFTYQGAFHRIERPIRLRPRPNLERIHLYGAIGSPPSATIMADLDLPPLSIANFPLEKHAQILDNWRRRRAEIGGATDGVKPIVVNALIADSDAEAEALAKRYLPPFFALQARHYETDADYWHDIKGYEQFGKFFANLKRLADPEGIAPWLALQLVGSPATVQDKVARYLELGFDKVVVHVATVGVPRALRHEVLRRFAAEVAPEFSPTFKNRSAA